MPARDRMQPSLIEKLFDEAPKHYEEEHHRLFRDFKAALNRGEIRAAEPDPTAKSGWRVNAWVKPGDHSKLYLIMTRTLGSVEKLN